jgi:hypothetical protein
MPDLPKMIVSSNMLDAAERLLEVYSKPSYPAQMQEARDRFVEAAFDANGRYAGFSLQTDPSALVPLLNEKERAAAATQFNAILRQAIRDSGERMKPAGETSEAFWAVGARQDVLDIDFYDNGVPPSLARKHAHNLESERLIPTMP